MDFNYLYGLNLQNLEFKFAALRWIIEFHFSSLLNRILPTFFYFILFLFQEEAPLA